MKHSLLLRSINNRTNPRSTMADEEHFSLCWNNFNSNLSTGFHESLCRGDLVDVTLVAEGQMVKAHRLVLSVCSPLFREMFANMQQNQQAFGESKATWIAFPRPTITNSPFIISVVLPNITHTALQDLITFIYCGEVNVKNEALSTFISTAESLQIKGLTDNETPAKVEQASTVLSPQIITMSAPQQQTPAPVIRQQITRSAPIKRVSRHSAVESEDSSTDNNPAPTVVASKRIIAPKPVIQSKRIKISAASTPTQSPAIATTSKKAPPQPDPLTMKTEEVMIEMPSMELAAEDEEEETATEEVTQGESMIEDDTYGEMKYDESYFTENETENKAAATSYQVDQSTGDVTHADNQG